MLIALCDLEGTPEGAQVSDLATRARQWLVINQNADGGWTGAKGGASSVEETALALEALSAASSLDDAAREAIETGLQWLAGRIEKGAGRDPSPIGFYFARLWYYERLYPLIFPVAALTVADRNADLFRPAAAD